MARLLKRLAEPAGAADLTEDRLRCAIATLLYLATKRMDAVGTVLAPSDPGSAERYVRLLQECALDQAAKFSKLAETFCRRQTCQARVAI